MALIPCEKCGLPVSDDAVRCVHCGVALTTAVTNREGTTGKRLATLALIVVGALAVIGAGAYWLGWLLRPATGP